MLTAEQYYKKTGRIPKPDQLARFNSSLKRARAQMLEGVRGQAKYGGRGNFEIDTRTVKTAYRKNLNPLLMGGVSKYNLGGDRIDIPNALAQRLLFTAAYNKGRYDPRDFFGARQFNPVGQYQSGRYMQARAQAYKKAQPKAFTERYGITYKDTWNMRRDKLKGQQRSLYSQLYKSNQVYKEKRSAQGQFLTADVRGGMKKKLAALNKQISRMGRGPSRGRGMRREFDLRDASRIYKGAPTTSNIKFREKVQKVNIFAK